MKKYCVSSVCAGVVLLLLLVVCVTVPEAFADLPKTLTPAASTQVAAPEEFSMFGSFVRMVGATLFCLGVFAAGVHLYRKYAGINVRPGVRRMTILERLAVTQKSAVYLVALDGKEFLVTSGPDNLRVATIPTQNRGDFDASLAAACDDTGVYNA